ncbi:hypothetical protein GA0070624_2157 [Micromonospora rhizosphaerae]|uniref:Uncharacterized protein n=1 Tax=Micromonospora rhizosphaerae TaxID=568872 RepID=A0A1C6RUR3_9ACTN|nr:hypothetical protein GA0070624_2157 [Micromonospora rhizosphaerae]
MSHPAVLPGGFEAALAGPADRPGLQPRRLTAALAERRIVALGVDVSAAAVRLAPGRGAVVLRRDVPAPLPGEGRWAHAVLVDGHIGIGGDPARLLRRCADLLRSGGTALVELAPPGSGLWRGRAHVSSGRDAGAERGPSFRWTRVGVEWPRRPASRTGAGGRAGCIQFEDRPAGGNRRQCRRVWIRVSTWRVTGRSTRSRESPTSRSISGTAKSISCRVLTCSGDRSCTQ